MAQGPEGQHPDRADADAPRHLTGAGTLTAKLAVCVLALGVMGAGVLSTRQSRLQAAHEVTAARLRIRAHDERLLTLRAQIAERVSLEAVHEMVDELDGVVLAPIAGRTTRLVPYETLPGGDAERSDDLPDDLQRLLDEINGGAGPSDEGGRVGR